MSFLKRMKRGYKLFNRYSKYRAVRTVVDGIKFASKAEAALYVHLKQAGWSPIETQPKVYLTKAKILFKPDFKCGSIFFEMKGMKTPSYRIKERLWQHYGPSVLHIYQMKNDKVAHVDSIIPYALSGE